MKMTPVELKIVLTSLNDRESVLSSYFQTASKVNSTALLQQICDELREVRALADKVASHMHAAAA